MILNFGLLLPVLLFTDLVQSQIPSGRSDTPIESGDGKTEAFYPEVFDLAKGSIITVNATCGQVGPEAYCHFSPDGRETECGVCDATSLNPERRHPISNAIDGTNSWWQSPTLQKSRRFEWVTITIDLKQVFQIHYVKIKAARSPLPGNWILERSIDGIEYKPWQYFAVSNTDCWRYYGTKPIAHHPPHFRTDDEVICTSYFASLRKLQNGEIDVALMEGRPGFILLTETLRQFTKARFIRLRFQKLQTSWDERGIFPYNERFNLSSANQLYYTLQNIEIGGQCICNGHAKSCSIEKTTMLRKCDCLHNTCGENCEKCCPLFNQKPYRPATKKHAAVCEACQCHGHSTQCIYDRDVDARSGSISALGLRQGGGVCVNCQKHTTGNNCDQCLDGYFRPRGLAPNDTNPCRPCQCRGRGTTEYCIKDDSHVLTGREAGDCICKKGFQGKNCDTCAPGYRNYPRCDSCYCNHAGVVNPTSCDGPCICKANVEGPRCDRCKPGYYDLSADNPDGCAPCFCFGATKSCRSSDWGIEVVSSLRLLEDWRVSDLNGRKIVSPQRKDDHLVIADDDMQPITNPYYWVAPKEYLGDKLYSYGGDLRFMIGYTVLRGDTSGYYTEDADIILDGGPEDLRIGYNWRKYDTNEEDKVTITLPLRENGWSVLGQDGRRVRPVSREKFTLVLHNLKRMLIRAKFHTDQIEGTMYNVEMEKASKDSMSLDKQEGAEMCDCPEGYTGLSCLECAPGYRRVDNVLVGGRCEKCNCNNHAESCDPFIGECSQCLHNTQGPTCGECKRGFYGDPLRGTPDDCKPCACPLLLPSNNFSPTCVAAPYGSGDDYVCDACQDPYTGKKCERCKDGYHGDPSVPGGECVPCECGPNVDTSKPGFCDHRTGQCRCEGNTTGWKCDQCAANHWGNPAIGDCKPCNCDLSGSVDAQCDPKTGQCFCKPNFTRRLCDRCTTGHGNLELGCPPCNCNPIGSSSSDCDPITGQCLCKPGVFGQHCSKCLEGYFGFSARGCTPCDCHPKGSEDRTCDEVSGQCHCKQLVEGRDCSRCRPGFWNLESGKGCEPCNCSPVGSLSQVCDGNTGQCECKPGIGGLKCDQCKSGWYGFSASGCLKCDPCYQPNHICNPETGKCECPPNTAGKDCRDCAPGTYGLDILEGCKACECDVQGSVNNQCHNKTGECFCLDGFEGKDCSKCRFGYYRFPNCRRCDCHPPGTREDTCQVDLRSGKGLIEPSSICKCDETGQCTCKANTMGRRCDRCKDATFSLVATNPLGCFSCFCFEKTSRCEQSQLVFTSITLPPREVSFGISDTPAENKLGYNVIPETREDKTVVGSNYVTDQPYYWQLPKEFLGDKVTSYNGYLSFRTLFRESSRFPENLLRRYPLLVLQGNQRLVLNHYEKDTPFTSSSYLGEFHRIHLHESNFILAENPQLEVTRKHLMIALQKVQHILIRASTGPDVQTARLSDVSMEVGEDLRLSVTGGAVNFSAIGVEQCRCPPQYRGPSCQDPNIGYYRKRKPNYLDSRDYIDLVGWAEPCPCNNRSTNCDPETGHCFNCTENTAGPYCNLCAPGYYGDPTQGIPCIPCHCPLPGHSFAESCETRSGTDYICSDCQKGYTGSRCEKCDEGYYGDPMAREFCQPCSCSPYGSFSSSCDRKTGQCRCKEGFRGRDCSICLPRHVQTESGCLDCDGPCTGLLLDDLDSLNATLAEFPTTDWSNLPYTKFLNLLSKYKTFINTLQRHQILIDGGKRLMYNVTSAFDLETLADILYLRAANMEARLPLIVEDTIRAGDDAENMLDLINDLLDELMRIIAALRNFGTDDGNGSGYNLERMVFRAEQILSELMIRNFGPRSEEAHREGRRAKSLLERIIGLLKTPNVDKDFRNRLDRLQSRLSEILSIVQGRVQRPIQITLRRISEGQRTRAYIVDNIVTSQGHAAQANASLSEARRLIGIARSSLMDITVKHGLVPGLVRDFRNATLAIENLRSALARLNPEYLAKYVVPCKQHADKLMQQLDYLKGLFADTENFSKYALEAARVYERIVHALSRAEESARRAYEAAERAYQEAYPGIEDSLTKQAQRAKEKSYQLLESARDLRDNRVRSLERDLAQKRSALNGLAEDLYNSKRKLDMINRQLDELPGDLRNQIMQIDQKLSFLLEGLGHVHMKIDNNHQKVQDDFIPRLERLKEGTASGIENLTQIIEKARLDIRDSSRLLVSSENLKARINALKDRFELDLTDLKHRILLARQKASSIRVSLGAEKDEICVKSYRAPTQPSATNMISLNYAIKEDVANSLLLFISSATNSDFMAVEMVNRRIRFTWNAGSGPKSLEHPTIIETNDQNLLRGRHWYKIDVNRINNVVTLSVQPSPRAHETDPNEITGSSDPKSCKMDIDDKAHFYIGSLPDTFEAPTVLRSRKFTGCLYEVFLDEQRIGLWNFKTSMGCRGCMEGVTESADPGTFQFKGDSSYAVMDQITRYDREKYIVALQFKTLDENAMIFFSGNPDTGDFVSISLQDGRLLYQFNLGSGSRLQLRSRDRYNKGQWVRLAAERDRWLGVLSVDEEVLEGSVNQGPSQLDLNHVQIYFGGVTPNFTQDLWTSVTFKPFLGCMKDVQIDTTPLNLLSIENYGVVAGCKDRTSRIVQFTGQGYLELRSIPLGEESDFTFTFKTNQSDTLLVMSTFQGKSKRMRDSHYYSVAVIGGLLEARFNGGSGETLLISELRVNDGTFHTVTISKRHRRISLTLDDNEVAVSRLAKGTTVIEAPTDGGLFLGGIADTMTLRGMAGTKERLVGVIRDFVFGGQIVKMNEPVSFKGVGIGRGR